MKYLQTFALVMAAMILVVAAGSSRKVAPTQSKNVQSENPTKPPAALLDIPTSGESENPTDQATGAGATQAANYTIDWYSVNSGGAIAGASANYRMGLSVGQAVAGEGSSENFGMGMGFWYGVPDTSGPCPIVVAGDTNDDGVPNAADVITLVNWIFKSLGQPAPCEAAGDINCDGQPTAADIIAEVNFVFKSMALPCHACDSPLASQC